MDLYAPLSTENKPLVSRDVGEISTNDALFQEQAATAAAAAASQSNRLVQLSNVNCCKLSKRSFNMLQKLSMETNCRTHAIYAIHE
jgi:hypothetical protein